METGILGGLSVRVRFTNSSLSLGLALLEELDYLFEVLNWVAPPSIVMGTVLDDVLTADPAFLFHDVTQAVHVREWNQLIQFCYIHSSLTFNKENWGRNSVNNFLGFPVVA